MVSSLELSGILSSGTSGLAGGSKMNAEVYKPAVLTNRVTGKRQEILLFDFRDEDIEAKLLAVATDPELREDLRRALENFSTMEKRILFRVLVQGQSLREATLRMKQSARTWERWYAEKAIPTLRACLSDYRDDVRTRGSYVPVASVETDEEAPAPKKTFKCKLCTHTETARTEATGLKALRSHFEKDHMAENQALKASIRDTDDVLYRELYLLHEDRSLWAKEDAEAL